MQRPNGHGEVLRSNSTQKAAPAVSSAGTSDSKAAHQHAAKDMIAEYARFALLALVFTAAAICLHIQQWIGAPLYWYSRTWSESWQAYVKESGALLSLALNQWRAPVTAHISSDSSMKGQIRRTKDGKVVLDFPRRVVLVANHQLYTDWLYLWWSAYVCGNHGYIIIILKDAIKKVPILGQGFVFFSWVFLSRRWETDESRLKQSMAHLSSSGKSTPMWLLMFPEGTNLSKRSMGLSRKWADKSGLPLLDLALLPRSRGLHACLEGLANSVDWMYDCTIAYEGIPPGVDGQDVFNLKTLYIEGRGAPATHIYWRRFAIAEMPLHDFHAFDQWLYERWAEKDKLLQHFQSYGRFPADDGYVEAELKLQRSIEIVQIFTCLLAAAAAWLVGSYIYWLLVAVIALIRGMMFSS